MSSCDKSRETTSSNSFFEEINIKIENDDVELSENEVDIKSEPYDYEDSSSTMASDDTDTNNPIETNKPEESQDQGLIIINKEILENQRKRKRKTMDNQYRIYLKELETNSLFKLSVTKPNDENRYLSKEIWNKLADKLNDTPNGPQLSDDEWKKRFADWKHSTLSKYRKICKSKTAATLTQFEKQGLALWGKTETTNSKISSDSNLKTETNLKIKSPEPQSSAENVETLGSNALKKRKIESSSPLNEIKQIIENTKNYKENTKNLSFAETYLYFKTAKLKFEIAKFKLENPGFEFDGND